MTDEEIARRLMLIARSIFEVPLSTGIARRAKDSTSMVVLRGRIGEFTYLSYQTYSNVFLQGIGGLVTADWILQEFHRVIKAQHEYQTKGTK